MRGRKGGGEGKISRLEGKASSCLVAGKSGVLKSPASMNTNKGHYLGHVLYTRVTYQQHVCCTSGFIDGGVFC